MVYEYVTRTPPEGGDAQEMLEIADCGIRIPVTPAVGAMVFSIYAQADAARQIVINIGNNTKTVTVGTAWQRIEWAVDGSDDVYITATGNTPVYLYKVQMEIGTLPSEWKPAPEDMQEQVDAVEDVARMTYDELESRLTLDEDGLHVGKNDGGAANGSEILIRTGTNPTIDFIFAGTVESSIARDYHRFGNMEIRVPRVGGFVFQAAEEG